MPELPEVETIRRHLAPRVEGRTLTALEVLDERWCRPLAVREIADAVTGRVIERLGRRGKYLVWQLSGEVFMFLHLRMTGTLLLDPPARPPHTRVRFDLDAGAAELLFVDPRPSGTGERAVCENSPDSFSAAGLASEPLAPEFP